MIDNIINNEITISASIVTEFCSGISVFGAILSVILIEIIPEKPINSCIIPIIIASLSLGASFPANP